MVLQSSSTRKQRGIMLHWFRAHSGSLQIAWEIRLARDDAGSRQAAGRQQARSRRGRMCPQQAEAWLLIDTLTATDCASRRRGGKPGWLQKGKQWKPLCTRVLWFYASRVRTSVQLVRRGVNVPQRAGVVQQLLRVHPSDLTYNCTNYLTTSITFPPFHAYNSLFPLSE